MRAAPSLSAFPTDEQSLLIAPALSCGLWLAGHEDTFVVCLVEDCLVPFLADEGLRSGWV